MKKPEIILVADTESVVPQKNETLDNFKTEIWGCGYAELGGDEVFIFNRIDAMLDDIYYKYGKLFDVKIYFHNLAWDGQLILDHLIRKHGFSRGNNQRLSKKEYWTMISDKGQWYRFNFKWKRCSFNLVDSLKILPFSLDAIAKGFGTKHKKLKGEIDYRIKRYEGWKITDEERKYLENDVFIMAEALKAVEPYGLLDHLTIGSTCLDYYKTMMGKAFKIYFPFIGEELDAEIRKSYRGGWCYVNPIYENHELTDVDGFTYDVNSLYPYSMSSHVLEGDEKHIYPVGLPIAVIENESDLEKYEDYCYFVKINTKFKVKKNHLPFLQIKRSIFKENEYIKDSEVIVQMTLTKPDFELFLEHYDIEYLDIVEGWVFEGAEGLFDKYIDEWFEKKAEATRTGNKVVRQLSKLFLNNLYGKFSSSLNANSKIPFFEDDKIKWKVDMGVKKGVYIPVGAYCTAYARCKTVRAAQKNYFQFCYADTDSIHCIGQADGLQVDGVKLGAWANESRWDMARFVRQKTYTEHVVEEDGEKVDEPYWNIKAAGCPEECKKNMLCDDEREFLHKFTYGLEVDGKLGRKTVAGGCILIETTFRIVK